MTVSISKYKLSKPEHTIALDYTLGENEKPFTDRYAYNFRAFLHIGMGFVNMRWSGCLSNQAHLTSYVPRALLQSSLLLNSGDIVRTSKMGVTYDDIECTFGLKKC